MAELEGCDVAVDDFAGLDEGEVFSDAELVGDEGAEVIEPAAGVIALDGGGGGGGAARGAGMGGETDGAEALVLPGGGEAGLGLDLDVLHEVLGEGGKRGKQRC